MSGATCDAGMLVALDRNERRAWVIRLVESGETPTVPTVVTAQAWRHDQRQARLAQALRSCRSEPLSDESAKKTGELIRRSQTADIVDAAVVVSAARRGDDVWTSDVAGLEHLAQHVARGLRIIRVRG